MHKIKTHLLPPFYVPFPNYLQAELSQICLHKCAVSLQKEFPKNEIPTPKPQKFKLNLIALKKINTWKDEKCRYTKKKVAIR